MARMRVVSRTILGTKVTTLCVDMGTKSLVTRDLTLTGVFEDSEKLLKALRKAYEDDALKIVQVMTTEPYNQLLAMREEDFIRLAKPMDPETHKFMDSDEETEE